MFKDTKKYIEKLLQPNSKDSIKSFAMFTSVLCGVFLTLCLGISLCYDSYKDGSIDTDLVGCAAYVASIGAMIGLSALPKAIVDKAKVSQPNEEGNMDAPEEKDAL